LACAAGSHYFASGLIAKRADVRFVSHAPDRMTNHVEPSPSANPRNQMVAIQVFEKGGTNERRPATAAKPSLLCGSRVATSF
jgi:hypothetical protein